MIVEDQELTNIIGGGISYSLAVALGAIGVFIVGVIDGFLRPLKCNR